MSHIGEPVREWEVQEPVIAPRPIEVEPEKEVEVTPEKETVTVPEKEEEKVGV